MAIVEIESVRSKFEPGDSPKGSDYLDLIDTLAALPDISGKQDVVANVSSTEIGYLDGVTSAIQTQINTKAPTASPTFTGTVTIPSGSAITGVPYLATANTFTGGVQQITTASAATVGLIVKGAASQTANLQEWQDSTGTVNASMTSLGRLNIGGAGLGSYSLTIRATDAIILYSPDNTSAIKSNIAYARGNTGGTPMYLGSIGDTANGVAAITTTSGAGSTSITSFGVNGNIVTNLQSASAIGLIIKGAASQTANLQEWQNSAGTVLASVNASGKLSSILPSGTFGDALSLGVNGTADLIKIGYTSAGVSYLIPSIYGQFQIQLPIATAGFAVKGFASQTANLQEWQNSAGTLMATVKADGSFRAGGANGATKFLVDQFGTLSLGTDRNITGTATYLFVQSQATTDIGAVIKGFASQTANLQQWQNSAGTVLASVGSAGALNINTSGTGTINIGDGVLSKGPGNGFTFNSDINLLDGKGLNSSLGIFTNVTGITTVPLTVKAIASQTADLQQWQNSSGTVLGRVASNGVIKANVGLVAESNTSGNYTALQVNSYVTSGVGIIIVGAASQTADLQQWMNSAGTVLAKVNSSGNIVAGNMAIATSSVSTIHISNGTIPSADPTGGGVLYVEAGALKFRGSSGTVTTIAVA